MTKALYLASLLLLFCSTSVLAQTHTMRVATYNIRYDNKSDTVNAWNKRLPVIADLVQFHDFDIFGTQEVQHHQLEGMAKALPGYGHIGVGRDDGKQAGEYAAVFYKKDKYKLEKQGHFWLSETPEKPGKGWDADFPRVCTWGEFRDQTTGYTFYLFNVHFDHRGEKARTESVKLIQQKIKEIAGKAPVILAGDFNFSQKDEKYTAMSTGSNLTPAFQLADKRYAPRGTFNGFEANRHTDERIDHIWLSSDFKVARYGILTDTYANGLFPSDHFPVVAEVKYEAKKK
ncbi:endonuclease/exonuclease/phosphatase family protein [Pontibacter anaerobius]|uniref:Endonuclease/exonuclease/phosphatase family protein n=1 Tax=Pontibacter anaerobius TaxID=2993940 RepID=A0ABT3RIP7_9BACT|nr:endonuclease/exonuclease/phosphatase family protein [Pontibacter anaerobius]MCX2741680.1 endonuclease/exonuclease/phosphatase family protein [Pontibacter anaerobius]